jgi:hypothetical protein
VVGAVVGHLGEHRCPRVLLAHDDAARGELVDEVRPRPLELDDRAQGIEEHR